MQTQACAGWGEGWGGGGGGRRQRAPRRACYGIASRGRDQYLFGSHCLTAYPSWNQKPFCLRKLRHAPEPGPLPGVISPDSGPRSGDVAPPAQLFEHSYSLGRVGLNSWGLRQNFFSLRSFSVRHWAGFEFGPTRLTWPARGHGFMIPATRIQVEDGSDQDDGPY
jgi:hypothetical protein